MVGQSVGVTLHQKQGQLRLGDIFKDRGIREIGSLNLIGRGRLQRSKFLSGEVEMQLLMRDDRNSIKFGWNENPPAQCLNDRLLYSVPNPLQNLDLDD